MAENQQSTSRGPEPEWWERQVLAPHRWGAHADQGERERRRLWLLWEQIEPKDDRLRRMVDQVVMVHLCNWRMEESILELCAAIGLARAIETTEQDLDLQQEDKRWPQAFRYGCPASVTRKRWTKAWRYYLALRKWSSRKRTASYSAIQDYIDPEREVDRRVNELLGPHNLLKQLYVERLVLQFEFERWLDGYTAPDDVLLRGYDAAAKALDAEISSRESDPHILAAIREHGGRLGLCHHNAFRRHETIISSIGCNRWPGNLSEGGGSQASRVGRLASYLAPIEAWISQQAEDFVTSEPGKQIVRSLGEPNEQKLFLASLLVSLLRAEEQNERSSARMSDQAEQKSGGDVSTPASD